MQADKSGGVSGAHAIRVTTAGKGRANEITDATILLDGGGGVIDLGRLFRTHACFPSLKAH